MTPHEYLEQLSAIPKLIASNSREISILEKLAKSIGSPGFSDMPPNTVHSSDPKFVELIEKIDELKSEIIDEGLQYVRLDRQIRNVINQVPNSKQVLLLRYRYIENMRWEDIARAMNYDGHYIFELHKKSLESVKKLIS